MNINLMKLKQKSWIGINDITHLSILRAILAEFLGSLILVFVGCASTLKWYAYPTPVLQIALGFGLTVATLCQIFGHVSGCHINPAISVGLIFTGNSSILRTILYIIVQLIGSALGIGLLSLITPKIVAQNLGITSVHFRMTELQGFIIELILTFMLVLVVCGVNDTRRVDIKGSSPLAIGFAVTAGHLAAVDFTGASMNPARSIGPAILNNNYDQLWVYIAGPMLGGLLGGLVYVLLFRFIPPREDGVPVEQT